jgi:hypothetical protein
MTEEQLMTRFIEENTDITLKYILWKELILQNEDPNYTNDGIDFTSN